MRISDWSSDVCSSDLAAGITGAGGVLSRQVAAIDGGKIDHPRIARSEAADEMTVRFAPGSGPRTLLLSSTFAQSFQIESIQPPPSRVEAVPEGQIMHFYAADGPTQGVLHLRPKNSGLARSRASLGRSEERRGGTECDSTYSSR